MENYKFKKKIEIIDKNEKKIIKFGDIETEKGKLLPK